MNILEVVNAVTGTNPRLVTQANGGEYSSPCPFCGGNKRFRTWPQKKDGQGRWWCRECGETGDSIDLLRRCKGMSFGEAKKMLGLSDDYHRRPKTGFQKKPHNPIWRPREFAFPSDIWRCFASKLIRRANEFISRPHPMQELWERRITVQTANFFHLGYIPKTCKLPGRVLGFPEKDEVWLPAGILIPAFRQKLAYQLRIRRERKTESGRYKIVTGSQIFPMIINGRYPTCVVVESDLDAIMIAQETSFLINTISLGSAQNRPDSFLHKKLKKATKIIVALDADESGDKGSEWWQKKYKHSVRLRPTEKDPGDMAALGASINRWLCEAL